MTLLDELLIKLDAVIEDDEASVQALDDVLVAIEVELEAQAQAGEVETQEGDDPPPAESDPTLLETQEGASGEFRANDVFETLEAEFDSDKMQAIITVIRPGWSRNNRFYTAEAIRNDHQVFDGAKMYINHPPKDKAGGPRDLNHLVSKLDETWVDEAGVMKGRVNFYRREFFDFAKAAKDDIGSSINSLCRGRENAVHEGKKGDIIEGFVHAHSVDWVTDAGAGGGIDRIGAILEADYSQEDQMKVLTDVTLEEFKKERPDLVTAIQAETGAEQLRMELDVATTKVTALEGTIAQGESIERVRTLVAQEERLPEPAKERVVAKFTGVVLEGAEAEQKVKEAIESELDYIGKLGGGRPSTSPKGDGKTFIRNVGEGAPDSGATQRGSLNSELDDRLGLQAPTAANGSES